MKKLSLAIISVFLLWSATGRAGPVTFDFKDPKGVNSISFILDSPLEPIQGLASGVEGTVTVDPEHIEKAAGRIAVPVARITFANPRMAETLQTEPWLNATEYPMISFELKEVTGIESTGENKWRLQVKGDFQIRGVTRELSTPVEIVYLPGRLTERVKGTEGDLMVLRTSFSIQRTDYGIQPDLGFTTVANDIEVQVAIVGAAPHAAP